ncbi:hypothetical protein [Yoonia sp.]|uniref:hypothetical protein n=1 Tax=Yoonia sp. TaxID=2212373 RepID=UPI00391B3EBE
MTTQLPGLIVDVEARIDKLEKSLKKANQTQNRSAQMMERRAAQSAARMRQSYETAGNGINAALKKIVLPMIGVAALTKVTREVRSTITEISTLAKVADRTSFDIEALQGLQRGFDLSGVAASDLNSGLETFGKNVGMAANGTGKLQKVLDTFGISIRDSRGNLKSQIDLLKEFADLTRSLPEQQRLAIASAAFGGSGAAMTNALAGGSAAIDEMINSAREGGFILDEELVRKAEILDDKFADLTRRTGTWFKSFAVGAADAVVELADFRSKLDDLFPSEEQGRAVLGDQVFDALAANRDIVDETAVEIAQLREQFTGLGEDARQTAAAMDQSSNLMRSYGYEEAAANLATASTEMRRLADEFDAGEIEAEDFAKSLDTVQTSAQSAFDTLDQSDRVDFSSVISEVGRLGGAIAGAISLASSLRTAIAAAAGQTITPGNIGAQQDADRAGSLASQRQASAARAALDGFTAAEEERNSKTRDRLALEREIADVMERAEEAGASLTAAQAEAVALAAIAAEEARAEAAKAAGAAGKDTGGGGGAASATLDEFAKAVEAIKAETTALEVEALALTISAAAGTDYAAAIDLARRKADLLTAALASGRADSPALRAEIDALTGSYADLAAANEATKDKIDATRAAQEQFGQIAESAFVSLITGASSFREALSGVLAQLGQMAASKAFVGLMSGGGTAGKIGKFLGYAEGGFTGPGGKYEPAGLVHKGEFVVSKAATSRLGVGNLQAMHSAALKGYSAGGYVGGALTAPALAAPAQAAPAISISAPITVNGSSGTPAQNADLAKQMAKELEASMRGVVMAEIQRQGRPGAMLGRK